MSPGHVRGEPRVSGDGDQDLDPLLSGRHGQAPAQSSALRGVQCVQSGEPDQPRQEPPASAGQAGGDPPVQGGAGARGRVVRAQTLVAPGGDQLGLECECQHLATPPGRPRRQAGGGAREVAGGEHDLYTHRG